MRKLIRNWPATLLVWAATLMFVPSCKPKEEPKTLAAPPPVTNSPPTAAAVVTEAPVATNTPIVIAPELAKQHIGDTVTVRGKVANVHVTAKGDVFVNFGGKYPNATFTAACFQGAIPADQLKLLNGKTISVTGKVKDYNGQVEIVLESVDQIGK
jgi:RecJ-like exonuclease